MKKQMPPTNRYYSLLQVLLFLENQLLFRDRFLEALPRRRTERETPPRAWGRDGVRRGDGVVGRNTPTGVGKSTTFTQKRIRVQKHPHGRGEERFQPSYFPPFEETPPRAWGRAILPPVIASDGGNTPTGVGKRAHSNFKQFEYYSIFFSFVKEPGSVCADFSIISCSPDMDVKSFVGMPFA